MRWPRTCWPPGCPWTVRHWRSGLGATGVVHHCHSGRTPTPRASTRRLPTGYAWCTSPLCTEPARSASTAPWTRRRRSTPPRDVPPCVRSPAPQSAYRAPTVVRVNSTKGVIASYPHPVFWVFGTVVALAVPGRSVRVCVLLPVRPLNIYVPWDCPERTRVLRHCGNRTCVPTWYGSTHVHHGVPAHPAPCRTDLFRTFRRRRSTPSPPCWPRTP